jgi:3-deoxy-D-manno-octulosonic acid kinase
VDVDAQPPDGSRIPFRDADGQGAIVFDPVRLRQADPRLFEGGRGEPVGAGRGHAWFVQGEFGAAVLRHYRRGGWIARLVRDRYLWLGETRTRSLAEFALMRRLRVLGLPVPAPLAASYRRRGPFYRAAILVERVVPASTFADRVAGQGLAAPWDRVGSAVGRCHARGARHADLNGHNLLLDGSDAVWLIDWDKGAIEPGPGDWCAAVLDRLERSLRKECPSLPARELGEGMRALRIAHDRALAA